jgi:hypothetical protein
MDNTNNNTPIVINGYTIEPGAKLEEAYLQGTDLQGAKLEGAYLQGAKLEGAYLQGADLQGADLRGTDLDFSCLPLWCGGTDFKGDDRLFSQLIYHITRINWEGCSKETQEDLSKLLSMYNLNTFCKYHNLEEI